MTSVNRKSFPFVLIACNAASISYGQEMPRPLTSPPAQIVEKCSDFLKLIGYTDPILGSWNGYPKSPFFDYKSKGEELNVLLNEDGIQHFQYIMQDIPGKLTHWKESYPRNTLMKKLLPKPRSGFSFKPLPVISIPFGNDPLGVEVYTFREVHSFYPVYPIPNVGFGFLRGSNQLASFGVGNRPKVKYDEPKIAATKAVEIANKFQKTVRKYLPKEAKVVSIVGPNSPKLVIHGSNQFADPDFVARRAKEPYDGKLTLYHLRQEDDVAWKVRRQLPESAVCWLVNVKGDICCVNAATGRVYSYRLAEQGPYFKLGMNQEVTFEFRSR